jgi:hypothetical protein
MSPSGSVIPFDATHLHFGKAQKEAVLELTPGRASLLIGACVEARPLIGGREGARLLNRGPSLNYFS